MHTFVIFLYASVFTMGALLIPILIIFAIGTTTEITVEEKLTDCIVAKDVGKYFCNKKVYDSLEVGKTYKCKVRLFNILRIKEEMVVEGNRGESI